MLKKVPNILTLIRLVAIPIYLYILFGMGDAYRIEALVVLAAASVTDFFDGYLARKLKATTEFGKIADPCVDRVLIITSMVALYLKSSSALPLWAVALVVGRDLTMLLGSLVMLSNNLQLPINMAGKVSTAVILIALCMLTARAVAGMELINIGLVFFYVGLTFSLVTGLFYLGWGTKMLLSKQGSARIPA